MSTLHEELAGGTTAPCKLCAFIATLHPDRRREWHIELALPVTEVSNLAVVLALRRRDVDITETSVRRHRRNHVAHVN